MSDKYGQYKVLTPAGSGGFGQIYVAEKENDIERKVYIIKALKKDMLSITNIEALQKEIDMIEELNRNPQNENIPTLYDFDKYNYEITEDERLQGNNNNIITDEESKKEINKNKARPYYVMDFYSRGNLYYYLKRMQYGLLEKHAKVIFKKIALAIKFCHDRNISHLDIKPLNIVFDKKFEPILIDYGFAEKYMNSHMEPIIFKGRKGTENYISPEMWKNKGYKGVEADIFSLGAILFNLVTGKSGFQSSKRSDKGYKLIINNKDNYEKYWEYIKSGIKVNFSQEFKNLYIKMVAYNPEDRPTIEQILESPWLQEINNLNEQEKITLDNEVRTEFEEIYQDLKEDNEELSVAEDYENLGYSTRGCESESKLLFTNKNLVPKKIPNNRINVNHYIIIKGHFNRIKFMNSLVKEMNKKFLNKCFISGEKEQLKFEVTFENDENEGEEENEEENEEEENKSCSMNIELFEYEDGRHLLEFLRTGGEIPEYYENFLKIKEIITKKLLNNNNSK